MFFRMHDGDRPDSGSFLSCVGNRADQEQSHADNQQEKPHSKLVYLGLPFTSTKRPGLGDRRGFQGLGGLAAHQASAYQSSVNSYHAFPDSPSSFT